MILNNDDHAGKWMGREYSLQVENSSVNFNLKTRNCIISTMIGHPGRK